MKNTRLVDQRRFNPHDLDEVVMRERTAVIDDADNNAFAGEQMAFMPMCRQQSDVVDRTLEARLMRLGSADSANESTLDDRKQLLVERRRIAFAIDDLARISRLQRDPRRHVAQSLVDLELFEIKLRNIQFQSFQLAAQHIGFHLDRCKLYEKRQALRGPALLIDSCSRLELFPVFRSDQRPYQAERRIENSRNIGRNGRDERRSFGARLIFSSGLSWRPIRGLIWRFRHPRFSLSPARVGPARR